MVTIQVSLRLSCIYNLPKVRLFLWLNKATFAAELQALGLPFALLALISHCVILYLCKDSSHSHFTFDKGWIENDMDR